MNLLKNLYRRTDMAKTIQIMLIVLIAAVFINFLRDGQSYHIAKVLPFCDGRPVDPMYGFAGIIMILILMWGIHRVNRNNREKKK